MDKYSFIKQNTKVLNDIRSVNQKQLSMNGVLKPLKIGSITSIINSEPQLIRNKIMLQLKRLQNLQMNLTNQINDPKYEKVKQKNMMDLNFLKKCTQIHKRYFSYILYSKTKGRMNIGVLQNLEVNYKKQLFTLSQLYKQKCLQFKGIDVTKGNIQNEIPE